MNENLDLTKVLSGCPAGTKFYNSVYGEVNFVEIDTSNVYPIKLEAYNKSTHSTKYIYYAKEGIYWYAYDGECTLFPSKDQRDWSKFERFWDKPKVEKFDPKTLQPFDKVLVRGYREDSIWTPVLFGYFIGPDDTFWQDGEKVICFDYAYYQCIPYNEDTKHLVGTTDGCPDYYKWWEE